MIALPSVSICSPSKYVSAASWITSPSLAALIAALERLPEDAAVTIYSDSRLCVDTLTKWAAGWKRRGWKRKGGPIANLELVRAAYALAQSHPEVRIEWIKAHDGSRWNEYADALAAVGA